MLSWLWYVTSSGYPTSPVFIWHADHWDSFSSPIWPVQRRTAPICVSAIDRSVQLISFRIPDSIAAYFSGNWANRWPQHLACCRPPYPIEEACGRDFQSIRLFLFLSVSEKIWTFMIIDFDKVLIDIIHTFVPMHHSHLRTTLHLLFVCVSRFLLFHSPTRYISNIIINIKDCIHRHRILFVPISTLLLVLCVHETWDRS